MERVLKEGGKAPPGSQTAFCFNSVFKLNNKELLQGPISAPYFSPFTMLPDPLDSPHMKGFPLQFLESLSKEFLNELNFISAF